MPNVTTIEIDVRNVAKMKNFITAMEEIAGTTNDPNTATNIRAALDQLRKG